MVLRGRKFARRVDEAREFLSELEEGSVDSLQGALAQVEDLLVDWPQGDHEVKARLVTLQAQLSSDLTRKRRPSRKKSSSTKGKKKEAPSGATKTPREAAVSRRTRSKAAVPAPPGEPSPDAFELTHRVRGQLIRITGLRAHLTVHFRVPRRELLAEIERIFGELVDRLGRERFNWLQKTSTSEYAPLTTQSWNTLGRRFSPSGRDSVFIDIKGVSSDRGSAAALDLPDIGVNLEAHPRGSNHFADGLSRIRILFPIEELAAAPDAWRHVFVDLCRRVQLFSGLAGHLLAVSYTGLPLRELQALPVRAGELVAPCPAVDLPFDNGRTLLRTKTIHGIGWLTAISSDHLKKVGGLSALRRTLPGTVALDEIDGGLVLRAGPGPDAGRNAKLPEAQAATAKALKKIIAPYRVYPS